MVLRKQRIHHPSYETKQPKQLGIYDMTGNVHEWYSDLYASYSAEAQTNPVGPDHGGEHVIRGGACINTTNYCRVSYRYYYCTTQENQNLGFRLAMSK